MRPHGSGYAHFVFRILDVRELHFHVLALLRNRRLIRIMHDRREFIAAQPGAELPMRTIVGKYFLQYQGDTAQHRITGRVSVCIVHMLEIIKIDNKECAQLLFVLIIKKQAKVDVKKLTVTDFRQGIGK
jgi:hypothetical protein